MNMKWIGLLAVTFTGGLLLFAVSDFADFGDPRSPANAGALDGEAFSVSRHFITEAKRETAVPNLVTAVLADYRGYDTMMEVVVVFTAGIAIFAILRVLEAPAGRRFKINCVIESDHNRIIIGTTCRVLVPVIQIFALYVVAHGHYSPGGGFQGGVMLGASFILTALARDLDAALRRFSERSFMALGAIGILIYGGFGLLCQALERNFLDYSVLHRLMPATDPVMARSHAILGVEVGVAFTVTAIMFAIYANLSSKGEMQHGL